MEDEVICERSHYGAQMSRISSIMKGYAKYYKDYRKEVAEKN